MARVTATATSSRRLLLFAGLALVAALAIAGCGGGAGTAPSSRNAASAPFAWLAPGSPPAGWTIGRLPSGRASFAYPPGWRSIHTDPGTFSAALRDGDGRIRGYLNATPEQGPETLANWARFRPDHNKDEGDFDVVTEASARGLQFRTGSGSCVMDRYATSRAHYREIACLVHGSRANTVLVGAALPGDWARLGPQLERSISSLAT